MAFGLTRGRHGEERSLQGRASACARREAGSERFCSLTCSGNGKALVTVSLCSQRAAHRVPEERIGRRHRSAFPPS